MQGRSAALNSAISSFSLYTEDLSSESFVSREKKSRHVAYLKMRKFAGVDHVYFGQIINLKI